MTVLLHIERLVIDAGLGATRVDGEILREAIRAELGKLLTEVGPGWASSEAWRVAAPGFERQTQGGAEALGTQIAGALHGCLRSQQGGQIP